MKGRTYGEGCDKLAIVDVRVGSTDTAEGDYMRLISANGATAGSQGSNVPLRRRSSSPHLGMGTSRMSNF